MELLIHTEAVDMVLQEAWDLMAARIVLEDMVPEATEVLFMAMAIAIRPRKRRTKCSRSS